MRHDKTEIGIGISSGWSGPEFKKTVSMLNSIEHEIYHAHKCQNANKCWHFNIN